MTDQFVQVQPDSTGKLVATDQVTDDLGNVVQRQSVTIGDPNYYDAKVGVSRAGLAVDPGSSAEGAVADLLQQILDELRLHSLLMMNAFGGSGIGSNSLKDE